MIEILNISSDSHQKTMLTLADNTSVVMTFDFLPRTQKWVLGISRGEFSCNGLALCNHPNLLRSFRKRIPFGFTCLCADGVDPFDQNDFANGRVRIFLLDNTAGNTDVDDAEASVFTETV